MITEMIDAQGTLSHMTNLNIVRNPGQVVRRVVTGGEEINTVSQRRKLIVRLIDLTTNREAEKAVHRVAANGNDMRIGLRLINGTMTIIRLTDGSMDRKNSDNPFQLLWVVN